MIELSALSPRLRTVLEQLSRSHDDREQSEERATESDQPSPDCLTSSS